MYTHTYTLTHTHTRVYTHVYTHKHPHTHITHMYASYPTNIYYTHTLHMYTHRTPHTHLTHNMHTHITHIQVIGLIYRNTPYLINQKFSPGLVSHLHSHPMYPHPPPPHTHAHLPTPTMYTLPSTPAQPPRTHTFSLHPPHMHTIYLHTYIYPPSKCHTASAETTHTAYAATPLSHIPPHHHLHALPVPVL